MLRIRSATHTDCNNIPMEYHSTVYTPRYAIFLQEQVDPAHYVAITRDRKIRRVYVLGKLHSVNGAPSLESRRCRAWYQYNLIHRDDDKPGVYRRSDLRCWSHRGTYYRVGGKPAYMNFGTGELLGRNYVDAIRGGQVSTFNG